MIVTSSGGGASSWSSVALSPPCTDCQEEVDGFSLLIRDLDDDRSWVLGRADLLSSSGRCLVQSRPGVITIEHEEDGIAASVEIGVDPERALELRRLRVRNTGERDRRLEVISYIEVVLNAPAAHLAHPAFSKLFVQTERHAEGSTLLAHRRPRGNDERSLWAGHSLIGASVTGYETDRARFLGRGRRLEQAEALRGRAAAQGTTGNVLDPVFVLRSTLELAPGNIGDMTFALSAAEDRDRLLAGLAAAANAGIDAAFESIERQAKDRLEREGLSFEQAGADGDTKLTAALRTPAPFADRTSASTDEPRGRKSDLPGGKQESVSSFSADVLTQWNGLGGFAGGGREYVIRLELSADRLPVPPPRPWSNVIANEGFGFLISETGAGYTWAVNSREHRITPWYNDPLTDPIGEAIYLRDEETGEVWSPLPAPMPNGRDYEVRHGLGYTSFRHESAELLQETTLFVAPEDPVKITRLVLTNRSSRPRLVKVTSFARLVLGVLPDDGRLQVETEVVGESSDLLARNPMAEEFAARVAFAAVVAPTGASSVVGSTDRASFLGPGGACDRPAAVLNAEGLVPRSGAGLDPCFAHQLVLELAPGARSEACFLLGEERGRAEALALIARYRQADAIPRAWEANLARWNALSSRLQIRTPAPDLDAMINAWLPYQVLSCRLWGRSALYQSGGAFGFRDQLQDASALLYLDPSVTRAQILLHAAHQFVEGDVLHWWHPPLSKGIRTRFADDLLWLPYLTAHYVATTGDHALLAESARFLTAPHLDEGEDERFLVPEDSGESADVYEHCCRALDRSLSVGAHGLPLFGTGDWNDGMNRVGREGRGESVWMAFFLFRILSDFLPFVETRKDLARAKRYAEHREALRTAIEANAWDGAWYRRGYYDDGTPLGSRGSEECQIDALAQAWAVISGAASPERAAEAMASAEARLVSEKEGLIRLLTPPFQHTKQDPGYIKGYVPGVRENGGQYTHGALWMVKAMAMQGKYEDAARLLAMLGPMWHGSSAERVAIYQVEPYVIAADVYGAEPHIGRGGWTWYTGSAGWMYRVAIEDVLGLTLHDGKRLRIKPCIPLEWTELRIEYTLPGESTCYEIDLRNPEGGGSSVRAGEVDGLRVTIEDGALWIELQHDGARHHVEVLMDAGTA